MTSPLILPSSNGATMLPFDGQAQRTSSSPSCGACGGGTAVTGAAAVDAAGGIDAGTEATTGGAEAGFDAAPAVGTAFKGRVSTRATVTAFVVASNGSVPGGTTLSICPTSITFGLS